MADNKEQAVDSKQDEKYKLVDMDFVFNALTHQCIVIDIQSFDEFAVGHIHCALHLPVTNESLTEEDVVNCFKSTHLEVDDINRAVIIYGNNTNSDNQQFYHLLIDLIDNQYFEQNSNLNPCFFVMECPFKEFQSKYPFLCIRSESTLSSKSDRVSVQNEEIKEEEEDESPSVSSNEMNEINQIQHRNLEVLQQCNYPNVILHDALYLGDGRQAMDWTVIYNLGITHILNITRLIPNQFNGDSDTLKVLNLPPSVYTHFMDHPVKYLKLKLLDTENEAVSDHFESAFKFIQSALTENDGQNGNSVLVHCQMGISRSSTVCIGYLMKHRGWSLVDAYQHVKERRNRISPNKGFLKQLMLLEKELFDGKSTINDLHDRRIRNLKAFRKYLNGDQTVKRRNEAKFLKESLKVIATK